MREKISSANNVADKGLILISDIANLNDLVRELILNSDQDLLDKIAERARKMESSMTLFQEEIIASVRLIVEDDSDTEEQVKALLEKDGFRLK